VAAAFCQLMVMDGIALSEPASSPASASRDCTAWRPQRLPIPIRASDVRERRKNSDCSDTSAAASAASAAASPGPALLLPPAPEEERTPLSERVSPPQSTKSSSQPGERRARSACQRSARAGPRPSLPITSRRRGGRPTCSPPLTERGATGVGFNSRLRVRGSRAGSQSSSRETSLETAPFSFQRSPPDENAAPGNRSKELRSDSCETPTSRVETDPGQEKRRLGFGTTPIRQMPALSPIRTSLDARNRVSAGPSRAGRPPREPGTPGFGERREASTPVSPTSEAALPQWFTCMPSPSSGEHAKPSSSPRNSPRTPQHEDPAAGKGAKASPVASRTTGAGRSGPRSAAGAPSFAARRHRGERGQNSSSNSSKAERDFSHGPAGSRATKGGVAVSMRGVSLSRSPASRGGA